MEKETNLSNLQINVKNLGLSGNGLCGNGLSGNGLSGNGLDLLDFNLNLDFEKEFNLAELNN